jgi:hypothetical protein
VTVQLFERKQLVQAFRLPLWGQSADETPPNWLVKRMQSGDLVVNSLGGFTMQSPWGWQSCAAGDIVLLTDQDTIMFIGSDEFSSFEPVTSDTLLQAA